mgnify:CR=1 FL=1
MNREINFPAFKKAVEAKLNQMTKQQLFVVDVEKDTLWDTYLNAFPEGTNPIYKVRREYDCNCCKQFIRNVANIVTVENGQLVSIWDVQVDDEFQVVADALSKEVKNHAIRNIFLSKEPRYGQDKTHQMVEGGRIQTWNHFHFNVPSHLYTKDASSKLGESRANYEVFLRSLSEITLDAVDTVLELISQNSLYRGAEYKDALEKFRAAKIKFDKLKTDKERNIFCWDGIYGKNAANNIAAIRIRNTAVGTLLVDLTKGDDLEQAVRAFERIMAPTNYKRPTALVTKSMVDNARKELEKLGLIPALDRRYAELTDITINNVLYADRTAKRVISTDPFDELARSTSNTQKNFDKVEEVTIDNFVANILPKAESIELFVENRHTNNLVSLIAPVNKEAPNLFKWGNQFSWSYVGEVTDSIKERVKKAGGQVEGVFRASLSWFNYDDLDLHLIEPGGHEIYFGNRNTASPCGGKLDVDMNGVGGNTREPVENIIYPTANKLKEGIYKIVVVNFCKRETTNVGFEMELVMDGEVMLLSHPDAVPNRGSVTVAEVEYTKKGGFKLLKLLKSINNKSIAKEVWGIQTQNFHKVSVACLSPNCWDEQAVGNKHYFFMLEGCHNEDKARGFYNEFLSDDVSKHRKVLEIIGSKMKTDEAEHQLSGLGFSSTQRNHVLCRVKGNFNRVIKITF